MRKLVPFICVAAITTGALADNSDDASPWYQGVQFGIGVPLVVPFTSVNAFVGYANKKHESFWGKRFGARLAFDFSSGLTGTAKIKPLQDDQHKIDASIGYAGIDFDLNNIAQLDKITFDDDDKLTLNGGFVDIGGSTAVFNIKNQSVGAMIDFYPFGDTWFAGGIRLTGGYYFGTMKVGLTNTIANDIGGSYLIDAGGTDRIGFQSAAGSKIAAKLNWNYSGPYAGIGFDLGVFRGFKFYMDAGVVFARDPLKVSRKNITHPTLQAQFCPDGANCGQWETLLNAAGDKPNVEELTKNLTTNYIKNNIDNPAYAAAKSAIESAYGTNIDWNALADGLVGYLSGGTAPGWVSNLPSDVQNAFGEVQTNWDDLVGAAGNGLQHDIDNAWADYDKALSDLNHDLKDYKFMPMVKLGVMYRF
ncbi:MAG: hypothetical protein LBO08_01155 [Rickettsiales bacterium]|jgi:hypothetical protein|nr:hypothetical protein [Rickettsiales bacterium]